MNAQIAIAAPYQIAMKGIVSLAQLNAYATAPIPPATIPMIPPESLNRVGAPLRTAQITAAIGIVAKNIIYRRQRAEEALVAPRSIASRA